MLTFKHTNSILNSWRIEVCRETRYTCNLYLPVLGVDF
nr:MAG TPA: hypothetical protein [Caudoviricetes sp.]